MAKRLNPPSNFGGCQNCFLETLSKIQQERQHIYREISASLRNIKEAESQKQALLDNTKKKQQSMLRRNGQAH